MSLYPEEPELDQQQLAIWDKTQEITRTRKWLDKFLADFVEHRNKITFPEKYMADQSMSMVEDLARQISMMAAEILEMRNPKE